MVAESLLISKSSLILLVVEQFFAIKQLFVELLDRDAKLTMLQLKLLHLLLLGALSDDFHTTVRVLGHFNFLVQRALVSVD